MFHSDSWQFYVEYHINFKHLKAQILRSFLLFAMLFNRTDAKLSLTSWVENILPADKRDRP